MIEDIDPVELSRQLKKPSGETGLEIAGMLNSSNRSLYDLALEMADLKAGENLLEIGFGNGKHFPRYFEKQPDLSVTGVDFSELMCGEARALHPDLIREGRLQIHCADTRQLPLEERAFDWIIGLNVIYFWDQPGPHLRQIFRVLKPGGRFLIGYRPRKTVEHLAFTRQNFTLYEPEELDVLIKENGFEPVSEKSQSYEKKAPDGTLMQVSDMCLLVRRSGRGSAGG